MYCKNCGVKLEEGAKFCQSCGNRVNPQEKQEENPKLALKDKNLDVAAEDNISEPNQGGGDAFILLAEARNTASGMIKQGIIWGTVGLVITGITYIFAEPGGTYYLLWGPMIYGAYKFVQGLYYYKNPHKLVDKAIENLKKEAEKMSSDNKDGTVEKNQTKSKPTLVGWLVIAFIVGIFLLFVLLGTTG